MATFGKLKTTLVVATAMIAGFVGFSGRAADVPTARPLQAPPVEHSGSELQVLTFNVHGLPWPVVSSRSSQLAAIGARLAALHRLGRAPQVALLQEAFTANARAIARASGYRYAAYGPGDDGAFSAPLPPGAQKSLLDRGARWWKGEGVGKWEGSGLILLSDYPIQNVHRLTYSDQACAGYDCLAAKGTMLARLRLPDGRAVDVATTHLNSRKASGVEYDRANRAWLVQAEELQAFITAHRDSGVPLVMGGDFNVGHDLVRELGMADFATRLDRRAGDGLRDLAHAGIALPRDAAVEMAHAKDWQLTLDAPAVRLAPQSAWVPFGPGQRTDLSDHYGYVVRYALSATVPKHR